MKNPHIRQAVLGSALFFLLNATAWATTYNLTFSVGFLPDGWSVEINPPQGYRPNSECMSTWAVPSQNTYIAVNHDGYGNPVPVPTMPRFFTVQIADKDSGDCRAAKKYNTWTYNIIPSAAEGGYAKRINGRVQFNRYLNAAAQQWATYITALEVDPSSKQPYVGSAICDYGAGPWQSCLNQEVYGEEEANNIYVWFVYRY